MTRNTGNSRKTKEAETSEGANTPTPPPPYSEEDSKKSNEELTTMVQTLQEQMKQMKAQIESQVTAPPASDTETDQGAKALPSPAANTPANPMATAVASLGQALQSNSAMTALTGPTNVLHYIKELNKLQGDKAADAHPHEVLLKRLLREIVRAAALVHPEEDDTIADLAAKADNAPPNIKTQVIEFLREALIHRQVKCHKGQSPEDAIAGDTNNRKIMQADSISEIVELAIHRLASITSCNTRLAIATETTTVWNIAKTLTNASTPQNSDLCKLVGAATTVMRLAYRLPSDDTDRDNLILRMAQIVEDHNAAKMVTVLGEFTSRQIVNGVPAEVRSAVYFPSSRGRVQGKERIRLLHLWAKDASAQHGTKKELGGDAPPTGNVAPTTPAPVETTTTTATTPPLTTHAPSPTSFIGAASNGKHMASFAQATYEDVTHDKVIMAAGKLIQGDNVYAPRPELINKIQAMDATQLKETFITALREKAARTWTEDGQSA